MRGALVHTSSLSDGAGLEQHLLRQSGLSRIHMRENADVTNLHLRSFLTFPVDLNKAVRLRPAHTRWLVFLIIHAFHRKTNAFCSAIGKRDGVHTEKKSACGADTLVEGTIPVLAAIYENCLGKP